jgi:hypothetical protein
MNGQCFKRLDGIWEYQVCPYHNVTQKQISGAGKFWGILGIFKEWENEVGQHKTMLFHGA